MIELLDHQVITPTKFPDGTSQVWNLPKNILEELEFERKLGGFAPIDIYWTFESEDELMHVCQLAQLVRDYSTKVRLMVPFLPYGRQDKDVNNDSTFALHTFGKIISGFFDDVITLDAHSFKSSDFFGCEFHNLTPEQNIKHAIKEFGADHIVFPDESAFYRYRRLISYRNGDEHSVLIKYRDQATGSIDKISLLANKSFNFTHSRLLMVDDLCDGGATFIRAAKFIKNEYWKGGYDTPTIGLYVTHGIFSKGTKVLNDAGITQIFDKDGEVNV